MDRINDIFAKKIKTCRRNEGLTQAQLAEKLHVSTQAVSRWEKGGLPDIAMLNDIADCLSVSTDYLLGRQEQDTEDISEDILKNISRLPKEERFEKAYAYAWTSVIGTSDASDSMKNMLASKDSLKSEEGKGYLMQSVMPEGFALGEMTKESRFLFLAPAPEKPDIPYSAQDAYISCFKI